MPNVLCTFSYLIFPTRLFWDAYVYAHFLVWGNWSTEWSYCAEEHSQLTVREADVSLSKGPHPQPLCHSVLSRCSLNEWMNEWISSVEEVASYPLKISGIWTFSAVPKRNFNCWASVLKSEMRPNTLLHKNFILVIISNILYYFTIYKDFSLMSAQHVPILVLEILS